MYFRKIDLIRNYKRYYSESYFYVNISEFSLQIISYFHSLLGAISTIAWRDLAETMNLMENKYNCISGLLINIILMKLDMWLHVVEFSEICV